MSVLEAYNYKYCIIDFILNFYDYGHALTILLLDECLAEAK
jgi:hypothetical protein